MFKVLIPAGSLKTKIRRNAKALILEGFFRLAPFWANNTLFVSYMGLNNNTEGHAVLVVNPLLMLSRMNVLFYHSKKRINKKGLAPVYCRITLRGRRVDFSTGVYVAALVNEKIKGDDHFTDVQNAFLLHVKNKINEAFFSHKMKGLPISAETLKRVAMTNEISGKYFLDVAAEFIKHLQKKDITSDTVTNNQNYLNNIKKFVLSEVGRNLLLEEFRIKEAEELPNWLRNNLRSAGASHCAKHLEFCSNVFKYAIKCEYIAHNPLALLEIKRGRVKDIISMDAVEIKKWKAYPFQNSSFIKAKHLTLFQTGCGLAYGEMYRYKIVIGVDRKEWFKVDRKKTIKNPTGKPVLVPVFRLCRLILHYYDGVLPKMENQPYNRFLKEMAAIVGIDKHLTTHVGRKTFATKIHMKGGSVGIIKQLLGHKRESTTETYYIGHGQEGIINEMARIGMR